MASRFQRNRAPGWTSSDDEPSEEGETSSGEEESEEEHNSSKRSRTMDQAPASNIGVSSSDGKPSGRKVNNVWGEVLVDQQLSTGMRSGVSVMYGETFVPRGSETYDCTKTKEAVEKAEEAKGDVGRVPEEAMDKGDRNDDPFSDTYAEGPDLMAEVATRGKAGGDRKRPWQRGGQKRRTRADDGEKGGGNFDQANQFAQGGDRGRGRGGHWRGRGRGRGHYNGDRSHSGSRRKLEKISFNKDDPLKKIALAIAESLREPKTELIVRATQNIGMEKAIQIYYQTVDIENSGGKMTNDGRRRRTSGGVFLFLVRDDPEITQAQKDEIFGPDRDEYRQQLIAKRRLQQKEEGDVPKVESMEEEKSLKEAKEVFLEEALGKSKAGVSGGSDGKPEDVAMDG